MINQYTSSELFHLVGRSHPDDHEANYQILLKVLDSYCVSHPPHVPGVSPHRITTNWDKSIFTGELIVADVTCFCDIPYDTLGIHMRKYGMFGISFDRDFLIKYGARPVIYMPMRPSDPLWWGSIHCETLIRDIEQIWRGYRKQVIDPMGLTAKTRSLCEEPTSPQNAVSAMDEVITQYFLAFLKPFNSELPDDDPDNYYMEREWRRFGNSPFQPNDVRHVLVAPAFVARLKNERPLYSDKILPAP